MSAGTTEHRLQHIHTGWHKNPHHSISLQATYIYIYISLKKRTIYVTCINSVTSILFYAITLKDANKFPPNLAHSVSGECLTTWHRNNPLHLMCVCRLPCKFDRNLLATVKVRSWLTFSGHNIVSS